MRNEDTNTERARHMLNSYSAVRPEDLVPRPRPDMGTCSFDGRCECCGRHVSELTPFGGPGDPMVGDFSGVLLMQGLRHREPYSEEAVSALEEAKECYEADGREGPLDWMMVKYGQEKAERLYHAATAYGETESSWECRDCAVLGEDEYFERLRGGHEEEPH